MSRDPDRNREDLAALLSDLRTTLDELERTLDTDDATRRPTRRDPPRGRDVVRFTEEYTIPTVISILETTVQSLELLRGVLRLADPERGLQGARGDLDGVDRRMVEGTERALDDLRRALTGTEEPTDPVARDVFREARDLSAEIESRLAEARGAERDSRSRAERSAGRSGGVVIPVDDEEGDASDESAASEEGGEEPTDEPDSSVAIDVDAELESIREEVRDESAVTDGDDDRHEDESDRGEDESDRDENER
ncbi:DUF7547 family protein [Salinigranum rubrum]|uniref:DUF7547 family protein n=1 Tax=Salinigranum rubrum TaxID=755307 RepID=UPI001C1FB322|nr:hypothetical protein [Salinigranum rubrum]